MLKSYLDYDNDLSRKLLIDLKENRIPIDDYRRINRALTTILDYLYIEVELKEEEKVC